MAKRGAAPKAKAALTAVNEDTESDRALKSEDRSGNDSSFEGSSSGSEEESEVESKRARRAIPEKQYEFSSSSSSDSSSAEKRTSAMKQCNKTSRLVRPTKEISDSSSSDELSAFRISSDEEENVTKKKQQRRKKVNPLVARQKTKKVSNVQELSSSSSDAESEVDEERPRNKNTAPVEIKRAIKSLSASNRIKIAGSSSSSTEEDSELEEKVLSKKLALRSENKQVNLGHTKESSSSSSSDDDSALEQNSLQRKKPGLAKSRKTTTELNNSSKFEHLSSSSSGSDGDSELRGERPQKKKTNPGTSANRAKHVLDFEDLNSSGSSSEDDDNDEVEEKRPQKKRSSRKDTENVSNANDFEGLSSSSNNDEELEEQQPQQVTTCSPLKNSTNTKSGSDSSDFEDLSSSSSGEDNEEKQHMSEPLNIEPKMYDNEPESDSNNGGSASETDSEVAWHPHETTEGENSGEDDIAGKSNEGSGSEWGEDEWQDEGEFVEDNDGNLSDGEVRQAKYVMRNITSHVPLIEETAIRRGVKPTGPPIEFATTHLDEYARKFRWPQHVRNLRNADFSQDPSEILEDYEVLLETKQPGTDQGDQDVPKESAFAQVPRPIVALAAEALRCSSRKRERSAGSENQAEPSEQNPSASALLNIARIGGRFGDGFVESLLSANGKALQGIDNGFDYDKRCWSSLPTRKKPIANWRFVLEHVRRTMCRPEDPDTAIYPPMKHETFERITKRLKNLYGHTTQHEEYDMFKATSANSNNSATEGDN
ncbi:uncharacterized protein KRP23_7354 [Phytophthora ramorum]|uniref:uncharacterized protein n=1 Tax=Phytophthora ramorum TaxID=164328 RepID=UPI00309F6558|nr:hypothetical protein KRP23_7354 [Phytophthora ramorum]